MHSNQRVGIFIDVQNVYHSAKHLHKSHVNFNQLIKTLTADRFLVRSLAYVVKSDHLPQPEGGARSEGLFFEALKKAGIELRLKDLQVYPDGSKKADWDVGMAVDAVRLANTLDVIILVTGDGDFIPLVHYLKWGLGKQVELAAFPKTCSGKLREVADKFIDLETLPRILLRIRKKQTRKKNT